MVNPATRLGDARKSILMVLFVPSVERDGATAIDQDYWVNEALETLGRLFGGATAFPKAEGVWRDDERGGVLVRDQPVILHCYMAEDALSPPSDGPDPVEELGRFCRRMGTEAKQGEVGLVIDDHYVAFTDFNEE
jgi:hypothetical protein